MSKNKKKLFASLTAVITAISVAIGGAFTDPADLMKKQTTDAAPVVYQLDLDDAEECDAGQEEATKKKRRLGAVRDWISGLPAIIRALVCVPLWVLGNAVITLASTLWATALGPIIGTILKWALTAAALAGIYGLVMKLLHPEMSWKNIFHKKNLRGILISAAALALITAILPLVWEDFSKWQRLIQLAGGFLILGTTIYAAGHRWKIWDTNEVTNL